MTNAAPKKMDITTRRAREELKWPPDAMPGRALLSPSPANAASSVLPRILRDKAAVAIMLAALAAHPTAARASLDHQRLLEPQGWTLQAATAPAFNASPSMAAAAIPVPASQQVRSVVVVDWTVADYQTLIAGMDPTIPVIILKQGESGLEGLAQALSAYHDLDVIHLVTEGQGGAIQLGLQWVDDAAIQAGSGDVQTIGAALKEGGGVRLYGCSVAQGEAGKRFVNDLSRLLGDVAVAASMNPTGPTRLGGDWDLEYATGSNETVLPFSLGGRQNISHSLGCSISGVQPGSSTNGYSPWYKVYDGNGVWTLDKYDLWGGGSWYYGRGPSHPMGQTCCAYGSLASAEDSGEITCGPSVTAPTVVTNAANAITATGATLNGTESSNGASTTATFDYGLTVAYGSSATATQSPLAADASNSAVSATIGSLSCNTTYHFRAKGVNSAGTTNGGDLTFVTSACAPTVTDGNISISGASGTGGAYKIGDTITATWNNTAGGDNNSGITGVTVNFSQLGGSSAVAATNSSGTWTATYNIVAGAIDATNRNISVTATNGTPTTTGDTTNATVDNIAPTVTDARISISGGSGTGGAYIIGDTVTAAWNNTAIGDNNSDTIAGVTMNFSQFGGSSAVSASNFGGTWAATYTIVAGAIEAGSRNVTVTATDNAGNGTTTGDTSNATVDNLPPGMATGILSVPENSANDTPVGTVSSSGATSFSLTDDAGGRFAIDSSSGEVKVADGSLLNHETATSHNITVRTGDASGNTTDTVLAVTVTNVNEAPTLDLNGAGGGTTNTVTLAIAAEGLADATATAADIENDGADWISGSLTVQRVTSVGAADGSVHDVYNFTASSLFEVSGGAVVKGADGSGTLSTTPGSLQFATWSYTSASGQLVVNFDTNADTALVQEVVRHIGYTDATPYGDATIRFALSDGSLTTNADVLVTSTTIYVDQTAYDTDGDAADGFNLAEALALGVDGDTILIADGTYRGQFIATSAVTIDAVGGAGGAVTLEAPDNAEMVGSVQNNMRGKIRWVILDLRTAIPGAGTITVRNLHLDGRYQGPTQAADPSYLINMSGIATYDSNAVIDNVDIQHIAAPWGVEGDLEGITRDECILAEGSTALGATIVSVTIENSILGTFQKAGIDAWGANLDVTITDNQISGSGVHGLSGQNGIQIGSFNLNRPGTTGVISGNTIDNLGAPDALVASGYMATGIYPVTAGTVEIFNNTITLDPGASANSLLGVDLGYGLYDGRSGAANVHDNTFNGMSIGIMVDSASKSAVHTFSNNSLSTSGGDLLVYWYDPAGNGDVGGETLAGFGPGATIRVVGEDFGSGTVSEGDGSGLTANSVQVSESGGSTTLYVDTTVANGSTTAPLTITLAGVYQPSDFRPLGNSLYFNNKPAISAGGTTPFTEQTPVVVTGDIAINDSDGAGDWNGGTLTLQITVNPTADDRLTLPTADPGGSGIWVDSTSGNALMAGATQIGMADAPAVSGGTAWTFTFNGSASNALAQSTARAITFDNGSDTPVAGSRKVTFTATDKYGAAAYDSRTINVTPVNDPPVNTVVPEVTGTPRVGNELNASPGTWSDPDGDSPNYSYQWYRADDNLGVHAAEISGAIANTYTLTTGDAHKYLRVTVVADDGNGSSDQSADSVWTGISNSTPIFAGTPAISGSALAGQILSLADTGSGDADGDSVSLSYQWQADGGDLGGATAATYQLTTAEIGKSVTCRVTADDGQGQPNSTVTVTTAGVSVQADSDGDGVADSLDICPGSDDTLDGDSDTIPDGCDNCPVVNNTSQSDANGNGIGDACDTGDTDLDALSDADEIIAGTDPTDPDTDGDGFFDGHEVLAGTDPLDIMDEPLLTRPVVRSDFNGDGRRDVLWASTGGDNLVWLTGQDGTFVTTSSWMGTLDSAKWRILGSGDFDGDGNSDLLYRNDTTGQQQLLLSSQNGRKNETAIWFGHQMLDSSTWHFAAIGDFNGDGRADILWRRDDGYNLVWLTEAGGTGVATSHWMGGLNSSWTLLGTGDFNGDGNADLLYRQESTGRQQVYLTSADGLTNQTKHLLSHQMLASSGWRFAAIADFNGDGRDDVLWHMDADGGNLVWYTGADGLSVADTHWLGQLEGWWTLKSAGDFNGDGNADLLYRAEGNGQQLVYLTSSDGLTMETRKMLGRPVPPSSVWRYAGQ